MTSMGIGRNTTARNSEEIREDPNALGAQPDTREETGPESPPAEVGPEGKVKVKHVAGSDIVEDPQSGVSFSRGGEAQVVEQSVFERVSALPGEQFEVVEEDVQK
jgi:hypothetical protein